MKINPLYAKTLFCGSTYEYLFLGLVAVSKITFNNLLHKHDVYTPERLLRNLHKTHKNRALLHKHRALLQRNCAHKWTSIYLIHQKKTSAEVSTEHIGLFYTKHRALLQKRRTMEIDPLHTPERLLRISLILHPVA